MKNSLELKHHGDDSDTCVNDSYGNGSGTGNGAGFGDGHGNGYGS